MSGAHNVSGGSGLDMPLEGLRILLLDDDPSILRAISLFLASAGACVTKAGSASEAFAAFVRRRPHVIVADYAMPDTTGADFLRQVRTCADEAAAPTPAILFSALPTLSATAREAGFDGYLVKPIEPDVLISEIVRVTKKQPHARGWLTGISMTPCRAAGVSPIASAAGSETPAPGACEAMPQRNRPRVLVADDDAQVGAAVSRLLSFSCDVIGCVRDVDTLLDSAMQLRPDVVLLDFSLQGRVNALEACRLLQATTPQVSIVAFTADNDPEIRRAACEAGASGFVWKMQVATDLLSAIRAAADGNESAQQSRQGPV